MMRKDVICGKCEEEFKKEFGFSGELSHLDCPFGYNPKYICYKSIQPRCPYCGEEYENLLCWRVCGCD